MKLATSQEIRNIDRRTIREFGIPGPVLMENAAAAVMSEMERFFDGLAGVKVGILCGKGNNGGDGLALARRLRIRGVPVRVALLAPFAALQGEAKVHLSILRKTDVEIVQRAKEDDIADIIGWSDIVVDALLGVGLSSPLTGLYALAVELMNAAGRPVVSIDIPTGIHADTGAVLGSAVRADLTVTMVLPKRGLALYPGSGYAGHVRVADIGIPHEAVDRESISVSLLDHGSIWGVLPERERQGHKGDYGHLLVVAGSLGKAGAAVMAARAALRTGAGLVTVAAPSGIVPVVQQQVFEAMCFPAAESIDGTLGSGAEVELLKEAGRMSALAVGPGLSTHYETMQVVRSLVQNAGVPMVVDADGLNALAGATAILKRVKTPLVLTPHPGEMARLLDLTTAEVQQDRIGTAQSFAKTYGVTLVLKGAGTIVATPGGETFVNTTGNPGMATGGTGDALTGMIGSLLAQGYGPSWAACLAVYLHGKAGDLAAEEKGEAGMIAGDLIEKIPEAVKSLEIQS
ncbi:MAG: NAD(P)H-hydrate dehydratase [Nitrospiraceae bacterium]|nr:NAD(P)H-hydrate dehydratase [Nitrospiraceae bacterium]